MLKRLRYYIVSAMLLLSMAQAMAQVAMPDTVCIGTSRIYRVNDATVRSTYTWKIDGITQPSTTHQLSTTWNTAGTFLVSVQEHGENGCDGDIRSGLVIVRPIPIPNAGPDAIVCFGTSLRLNGSGGTVYQWSPGTYLSNPLIRDPLFTGTRAGVFTYLLAVTDDIGCKSSLRDTVVITVLPQARIFAGNDTSVSINQPLQLNAIDRSGSGFTSYSWSPSFGLSSSSVANPVALFNSISGSGGYNYTITARTAEGCIARDDINIKVFATADLYVPTGFTPDGDGLNDFAKVMPVGIKELKYFSIYSRWGELVFTTTNPAVGWNGIYKGQRQDANVFVWMAMAIDYKGNIIQKKGTVTLIR